jgi:hypothetical protein
MILRDYQKMIVEKGLEILQAHHIVYLSMQVRTGKTLTALALADQYGAEKVLFITKKKAIGSIESDFDKAQFTFDLTITNYESVHKITGDYDLIIIDEAHGLGQYPITSGRVTLLRRICEQTPIIYLSGTPTPESYSQLYHQFAVSSFSPWKAYKNFYSWAKDYVIVRKQMFHGHTVNDYSNAVLDKIKADTDHLFISFTQEEAGFEMPVTEEVILVQMQPATYTVADRLRRDKIYNGKEGRVVLGDTAVKLMNKLHQIYSGTVILDAPAGEGVVFDNSKADFIMDHFRDQKIAIFYKFTAELYMLTHVALRYKRTIAKTPEAFNEGDRNTIYLPQIASGREGINLSTADALVMLNIDFSALSYWQARARLQTRDRTTPAKVFWVFAHKGIEHKIYKTVLDKKDYTLSHFKKDYAGIPDTGQDKSKADPVRLAG